ARIGDSYALYQRASARVVRGRSGERDPELVVAGALSSPVVAEVGRGICERDVLDPEMIALAAVDIGRPERLELVAIALDAAVGGVRDKRIEMHPVLVAVVDAVRIRVLLQVVAGRLRAHLPLDRVGHSIAVAVG